MAKVNMKITTYYTSGAHTANVLSAQINARKTHNRNKQTKIELYYLDPKICEAKECNVCLQYKFRNNRYCSKSCAAITNNTGRVHSVTSNNATSVSLTGKPHPGSRPTQLMCKITFRKCKICKKPFYIRWWRKDGKITCSRSCRIKAINLNRTYQNGSRKPVWYFNLYQQIPVLLDSSWEVEIADLLCEIDIEWTRPNPIDWIDSNNKSHLYFPDFYLPKYDLYLDPKNPYCLMLDTEKLSIVSK